MQVFKPLPCTDLKASSLKSCLSSLSFMYVFVNSIFPGKGTGLFLFKEQQKREKSVVSQRDNVKIILWQGFLPFALVACNTKYEAHTHKY